MNNADKNLADSKQRQRALLLLIAGASAIAFAPIFVRRSEVGPIATAFWRIFLATPFFIIYANINNRRKANAAPKKLTRKLKFMLCLPGICFAGDLSFYHSAVKLTTVANATLLTNLQPIFVAFVLWMFYKQKISMGFLIGLIITFAGSFFLINASFNIDSKHVLGDILGIISGVCYAGYLLSVKELRNYFPASKIMLWKVIVISIVLLPLTLMIDKTLIPVTFFGWAILAGYMFVAQVGGQFLISHSIGHLPADYSSITLLVQPVVSTIFAYILLGESVAFTQIVGGFFVLTGIRIAQRASAVKDIPIE